VLIVAGIFVGGLLAIAIISAASIAIYAHFVTPPSYWSEISQTLLNQPVKPTARVAEEIQDQGRSLIPLRQALEMAAREVPGEVLKVELEREHGRAVYEIKILAQNGQVREVSLDARNGEIIEVEDD